MDFNDYLQNLNTNELEVEFVVRGINSKNDDSKQLLMQRLADENINQQLKSAKCQEQQPRIHNWRLSNVVSNNKNY